MAPFRMKFRQLDSTRWAIGATVAIGALGLAASVQAMTSKGPQPKCSDQSGLKAKPNIYVPPGGGPVQPPVNAINNLGDFESQAAANGNTVMLFTDTVDPSTSGANYSTMAVEIDSSGEVIHTEVFDEATLEAMDNQPFLLVDTPYNDWYSNNASKLTDQRPASGSSSGGSSGGDPGDGGDDGSSSGSDDGGSSGSDAGGSSGSDPGGSSGSNTGSSGGSDSGSSSGGTDPSGSSGGTDPGDPGSSGGDDGGGGGGGGTC